jgi:hypothetical protein
MVFTYTALTDNPSSEQCISFSNDRYRDMPQSMMDRALRHALQLGAERLDDRPKQFLATGPSLL